MAERVFIKRNRVRLFLGKMFYTVKRYLKWYFGDIKFSLKHTDDLLPETAASHETPLLRKLQGLDMQAQFNKVKNLSIAVDQVNKVVIYPGETFSYWRLIGKPAKRKGYKPGMVLVNGAIQYGTGGGLCQLSNLIYWMTLHTPLKITERYRHSHDVFPDSNRTQPFGSGATCMYNYIDLQIKNETSHPYQLYVYMTDSELIGEWRTTDKADVHYEVYEKSHCITHEYWGDYVRHNVICRRVYNSSGEVVGDEFVTENHALMMYQPFLEAGSTTGQIGNTVI